MELIMKRITLILFTLVLASSVAGCGFGKKKEEKEQPKTVASQAALNPYDERVRVLQEEIARPQATHGNRRRQAERHAWAQDAISLEN